MTVVDAPPRPEPSQDELEALIEEARRRARRRRLVYAAATCAVVLGLGAALLIVALVRGGGGTAVPKGFVVVHSRGPVQHALIGLLHSGAATVDLATGRLVVAHEAVERGGYGAEVTARVQAEAWDALKGPVRRVGALNTPIPYSKPLETEMLPQRTDVVAAVKSAVGK